MAGFAFSVTLFKTETKQKKKIKKSVEMFKIFTVIKSVFSVPTRSVVIFTFYIHEHFIRRNKNTEI